MARSHSIHILQDPHTKEIRAAFTVKHEMLTWAERHGGLDSFSLVSVRDGIRQVDLGGEKISGGKNEKE